MKKKMILVLGFAITIMLIGQAAVARDINYSQVLKPDGSVVRDELPPEPSLSPPEKVKSKSISEASDDQILEARKYYKYCSENPTMASQKDCKCASAAYLDARLALGDAASVNDVMDSIKNECLVDESVPVLEGERDMSGLSDKELEEAKQFYDYCKGDMSFDAAYDCECLAAEMVQTRKKYKGTTVSMEAMILEVGGHCPNIVQMTGNFYMQCMSSAFVSRLTDVLPKTLCECSANGWAKKMKNYKGTMQQSVIQSMFNASQSQCLQSLRGR